MSVCDSQFRVVRAVSRQVVRWDLARLGDIEIRWPGIGSGRPPWLDCATQLVDYLDVLAVEPSHGGGAAEVDPVGRPIDNNVGELADRKLGDAGDDTIPKHGRHGVIDVLAGADHTARAGAGERPG